MDREGLRGQVAPSERSVLDGDGLTVDLKAGVESLWAMCWALGLVRALDFGQTCDDDFVTLFPDLKKDEPLEPFLGRLKPRPVDDVAAALDLAYCLHAAVFTGSPVADDLEARAT